jgi:DNA polymerase III alpha subunit
MTPGERLIADFRGTGLTVGLHAMAYHRPTLQRQGVRAASDLRSLPDGSHIRIAGAVIARQRPGTAKGFVFLSIEDETGIANAIITPQLFTQNRLAVVHQRFLLIDGVLQNQDNIISVKAQRIRPAQPLARRRSLARFPLAQPVFHAVIPSDRRESRNLHFLSLVVRPIQKAMVLYSASS